MSDFSTLVDALAVPEALVNTIRILVLNHPGGRVESSGGVVLNPPGGRFESSGGTPPPLHPAHGFPVCSRQAKTRKGELRKGIGYYINVTMCQHEGVPS